MTLVVTTASELGITVVGDRAVTRSSSLGLEILEARKVWYSKKANIALAFWGNANLPGGKSLQDWARQFTDTINRRDTVSEVCDRLADTLNLELECLGKEWWEMRRGIHVSGYENGVPVIFHVHTGDPQLFHHSLEVHRDYPDVHVGDAEEYRRRLGHSEFFQLRNGYFGLFEILAKGVFESGDELSKLLKKPIPARSLEGQAAFDEALVRLAAGILKAAQLPQSVSPRLDTIAFTSQGRVRI